MEPAFVPAAWQILCCCLLLHAVLGHMLSGRDASVDANAMQCCCTPRWVRVSCTGDTAAGAAWLWLLLQLQGPGALNNDDVIFKKAGLELIVLKASVWSDQQSRQSGSSISSSKVGSPL
jgi:hypothetical protein